MSAKWLPPAMRTQLIRETFEAYATVGFLKWKREEIERHGTAPEQVEAERASYIQELERISWPSFQAMAAKAPDDRLLDARQDWIERAEALGLLDREGNLTMQHVHDELRRYTGGTYPEPEKGAPSKQKGLDCGQATMRDVLEREPSPATPDQDCAIDKSRGR